jgi:hypothetical protein
MDYILILLGDFVKVIALMVFLRNLRRFPQNLRAVLIKYYFTKFEGVFVKLSQ